MPADEPGGFSMAMVDETPDLEAETVALDGYDPRWVSLSGPRAAQRAWQPGEFSIDLLATMAEWYTQHLAKKPRVGVCRLLFAANDRREKPTVVDANFLCDQVIQQLVHSQHRLPVLLRLEGQVVHLFGIAL